MDADPRPADTHERYLSMRHEREEEVTEKVTEKVTGARPDRKTEGDARKHETGKYDPLPEHLEAAGADRLLDLLRRRYSEDGPFLQAVSDFNAHTAGPKANRMRWMLTLLACDIHAEKGRGTSWEAVHGAINRTIPPAEANPIIRRMGRRVRLLKRLVRAGLEKRGDGEETEGKGTD